MEAYLLNTTVELPGLVYIHCVIYKVVVEDYPPDSIGLSWGLRHCLLEIPIPAQHLQLQTASGSAECLAIRESDKDRLK